MALAHLPTPKKALQAQEPRSPGARTQIRRRSSTRSPSGSAGAAGLEGRSPMRRGSVESARLAYIKHGQDKEDKDVLTNLVLQLVDTMQRPRWTPAVRIAATPPLVPSPNPTHTPAVTAHPHLHLHPHPHPRPRPHRCYHPLLQPHPHPHPGLHQVQISLSECRVNAHRVWRRGAAVSPHAVLISEVRDLPARPRATLHPGPCVDRNASP